MAKYDTRNGILSLLSQILPSWVHSSVAKTVENGKFNQILKFGKFCT